MIKHLLRLSLLNGPGSLLVFTDACQLGVLLKVPGRELGKGILLLTLELNAVADLRFHFARRA